MLLLNLKFESNFESFFNKKNDGAETRIKFLDVTSTVRSQTTQPLNLQYVVCNRVSREPPCNQPIIFHAYS
jgi:hypothetical protein